MMLDCAHRRMFEACSCCRCGEALIDCTYEHARGRTRRRAELDGICDCVRGSLCAASTAFTTKAQHQDVQ